MPAVGPLSDADFWNLIADRAHGSIRIFFFPIIFLIEVCGK